MAARPQGCCVVCPSRAGGRRQYFLHGPRHSQHLLDQFIRSADRRSMIVAGFVSDGLQGRKSHKAEWHIALICVLEIVHISRLQNVPLTFFGSSLLKSSSAMLCQENANCKLQATACLDLLRLEGSQSCDGLAGCSLRHLRDLLPWIFARHREAAMQREETPTRQRMLKIRQSAIR